MITALLHGPLVQRVLAWLLTYAVHSTVLLSTVWLVCRTLRGRALWLQDSLWKTALLGGILTASVQTAGGVQPLGGRIPLGAAPVASVSVPPMEAPPVRLAPLVVDVGVRAPLPTTAPLLPEPALRASWTHFAVPWSALGVALGVLALGVALTLLVRRGVALWQLQRRLAGRTRVAEPELLAIVEELRQKGGLRRPVRLSSGNHLTVPLAMGLWRPEICLPQRALHELSREQQRVVLAHEMAHLVRRDPTWLLLCRGLESVLFFQPLNRLAAQRLQVLSEYLCDDWSVGLTGRLLVFARCLTEVAGWVVEDGPALLPCMARPGSELSRRIGRLLEQQRSPWTTTRPRWLAPVLGGVLLAVAACAPRVCQVAVASPLPTAEAQPVDGEVAGGRYLVAVAEPAPRAPVASPARPVPAGVTSAPAKPGKAGKGRPQPPVAPAPPTPHAPAAPADVEAPEAPEPPAFPEPPAPPAAPAAPRMPLAAAPPVPPRPPAAPLTPVPPARPGWPVAPMAPAPPAEPVELTRLAQEQERLAHELIPSPEQLAQLDEKAAALAQAIERHDQAAEQRLQHELAALSAQLRPSPEALRRIREVGRQLGRQGRQLAPLHGGLSAQQRQEIQDQAHAAAERAREEAHRWSAEHHQASSASEPGPRAAERAHLEQELARLEHDRARLERDRARLAAQLQHLDAAPRPREPHHELPTTQP